MRLNLLWRCSLLALSLSATVAASASPDFPERPVKLVVPYPAAGAGDITARLLAKKLAEHWKQQVVVENKPGASNGIAAQAVATAAKDGHTLLLCTTTIATNEVAYRRRPYRIEDLEPVSIVVRHPYAMVVSTDVPAATPAEFVRHVRANPGKVNFATLGPGSTSNFLARQLARQYKLEMVEVPYKGSAEVGLALATGTVNFYLDAVNTAVPLHRAGKVRILGVTSAERVASAPELPTMGEQGFDFHHDSWFGICTTAGTPKPVVSEIGQAVRQAVASDEYQTRIKGMGAVPQSSASPEAFAAYMREQTESWANIIRPLNLMLD